MKLYGLKYINTDEKEFFVCCEPYLMATNDYSHEAITSYELCTKEEIEKKDIQLFLSPNKKSLTEESLRDMTKKIKIFFLKENLDTLKYLK
jgi:hypothetical protein